MSRYFIVDVEATSATPYSGVMTEFGVVHFRDTPDVNRETLLFLMALINLLPHSWFRHPGLTAYTY
ncbi:hypothetical protein [Corynebacterium sp. CCM 9204]|uniref:hypothetical protein n=1 Tax=Corynebacterium sp. CCM 9204 TaxID=3057616 RepID=UPI0035234FD3